MATDVSFDGYRDPGEVALEEQWRRDVSKYDHIWEDPRVNKNEHSDLVATAVEPNSIRDPIIGGEKERIYRGYPPRSVVVFDGIPLTDMDRRRLQLLAPKGTPEDVFPNLDETW